jgi:hypothetical protein
LGFHAGFALGAIVDAIVVAIDPLLGAEPAVLKGTGIGAGVGGTAGLLAGLGLLAIPGLGPVVAAGWLAATAVGAAAGGAIGGIVGALTEAGAFMRRMPTYTPRASAGAARWCLRE